jgi:SAM-dependent methyltransferase
MSASAEKIFIISRKIKMISKLKSFYVSLVYADHNRSTTVRKALKNILESQNEESFILNIGSGQARIAPNIKNLDIIAGPSVDYVGSAEMIPLDNQAVDLIITQEAFEHIQNPDKAINECFRVLKKGGIIYFQVPFIIGYHPGPTDFLRFTKEGVEEFLTRAGFSVRQIDITVGGATGYYRISVEFFAILVSGPINILYIPAKALFSFLLYPVKWFDFWFNWSRQKDRIPGGYFAIASKDRDFKYESMAKYDS